MALSAPTIKAAQPKDKVYTLSDVYGNGLAVYIYPDGRKVWKVRKPTMKNGKRSTVMGDLGEFPAVSIKEARERAAAWTPEIKAGKGKTVSALVDEWTENELKPYRRTETQRLIVCFINKYILPALGNMAAEKVTEQNITELCESIEHAGNMTSAARVRTITVAIFKYGKAHGFNTSNPAKGVELHTNTHKTESHAALTEPEDIAVFLRELAARSASVSNYALQFLIYTGLRAQEALTAEWWQIDFDNAVMTIPAEKMKMKVEHKIPLSRQALAILERMKQYGFSQIFHGTARGGFVSLSTLHWIIKGLGYKTGESKPKTTVHGFRSTLSTVLNEHGFISDIIEKQLAHTSLRAESLCD